MVTLSVDQVVFRQPIHVGELMTFLASINHVDVSSMEVGIKVIAENIQTRAKRHDNSCFFTMVAVDEHGKKCAVAPLEISSSDQRRRTEQAIHRGALRRELNSRFEASTQVRPLQRLLQQERTADSEP